MEFKGKEFFFNESPQIEHVIKEVFSDSYRVFEKKITFSKGDVILDIGANEGVFSVMMAKLFPDIEVYSYEPVPGTFYKMLRNIGSNGVTNVHPFNVGVGEKKCRKNLVVCDTLSGGSSGVQQQYDPTKNHIVTVDIITLDEVFNHSGAARVRLLKMDIEGMEYETLYKTTILEKVDYFVGEFHINNYLISKGYDIKELATYVGSKTNLTFYETMRMAE